MKKVLLLSLLGLKLTLSNAQPFMEQPDSNSAWTFARIFGPPPLTSDGYSCVYFPTNKEDTLIGIHHYSKAYKFSQPPIYFGAFRYDGNGRGYAVPPDSSKEYLTFDFNVNYGDTVDTIVVFSLEDILVGKAVISVFNDTLWVENIPYKQISADFIIPNSNPSGCLEWSEYYSHQSSPFNFVPASCVGGYTLEPVCVSSNDTIRYEYSPEFSPQIDFPEEGTQNSCLSSLVLSEHERIGKVSDSFNFVLLDNWLSVVNCQKNAEVIVLNSVGQVQVKYSVSKEPINTSSWANGFYLIQYSNGSYSKSYKFIKQ